MTAKNAYIIFTDLKKFSILNDDELKVFYTELLPELAKVIIKYKEKSIVFNTWGDGIVVICEDGKDAVDMMLEYKEFFKNYKFDERLRKLLPRIAGHFGQFEFFEDPILNINNALGENINTASRIEPITRTGEIFVTKSFKKAIEKLPKKIEYINFGELGFVPLAKKFGEFELYRIYKNDEKPQIIDKILKQDFSKALPEPPDMTVDEQKSIKYYNNFPDEIKLESDLLKIDLTDNTGKFVFELAKICKKNGLYKTAINFITKVEKKNIIVDDTIIYPYRFNKDLLKLKANCLTRIDEFEKAADILYGLWQIGIKDSDTLCMLAAQYKRRAIFNKAKKNSSANINKKLLERSICLYLEAFRIDNEAFEAYYPAINAAYLYKIIGGGETGRGNRLALYILDVWENFKGNDWWLDSSLSEAKLLLEEYRDAEEYFIEALKKHNPPRFEKKATLTQIELYSKLTNKEREVDKIVNLLK